MPEPTSPLIPLSAKLSLDTEHRQILVQDGDDLDLNGAECAVLELLAKRHNELCSKEELLAVGWPDRVVEYTSLAQCISHLRKKLQPFPEISLNTLSRRGYQLCLPELALEPTQTQAPEPYLWALPRPGRATWLALLGTLLLVALVIWYHADRHRMLQLTQKWERQAPMTLNFNNGRGQVSLWQPGNGLPVNRERLQELLVADPRAANMAFDGSVVANAFGHSLALCQEEGTDCVRPWVNLLIPHGTNQAVDLNSLMPLAHRMHKGPHFQPTRLPQRAPGQGEMREEIYHGQVLVPGKSPLALRQNLSLVYHDDNHGVLTSYSCLVEERMPGKPMKYQVSGKFTRYQTEIEGVPVEFYRVTELDKRFRHAQAISPAALPIYRHLRRASLENQDWWLLRVGAEAKMATFVLPYFDGTAMTLSRQALGV